MDKNKKTLTISTNLKKKLTLVKFHLETKVLFGRKKKTFKSTKTFNRQNNQVNPSFNQEVKKRNFARKFIEQQATKDFIKKDNKPAGKSKLKLKGPVDKRDFKLTVSRALNVEEIEIKQKEV